MPLLFHQVKVPVLLMPSGEDPDHLPLKEVLDKKPFGDKCQYRRFDDMHHGFCAGRYAWHACGPLAGGRCCFAARR